MRHPEHDALRKTVRSWYVESSPEMGYVTEKRRFGYYMRNAADPLFGRVTLEALEPVDVPRFLDDARDYYGNATVEVCVEDRAGDDRLREPLVEGGAKRHIAVIYLAHVGPVPEATAIPDLTVESCDASTVELYVRTKLIAFANSEEPPPATRIERETKHRIAELGGSGRFHLARLDGEPVAVIGWYEEERDRLVFQLGTRAPFRMQGIARRLLCDAVAEGYARGCRSVLINTDEKDTPTELYRRLGFTDEIYWSQEYVLNALD